MVSFYTLAIPPVLRGLKNGAAILAYAENYAKANNVDPEEYLSARLYADMKDFRFQVTQYSNFARFAVERVAKDVEPLVLPDIEKPSFADLIDRVQAVIKYLEAVKPEQFEGQEEKEIVVLAGQKKEFEFRLNGGELSFRSTPLNWLGSRCIC